MTQFLRQQQNGSWSDEEFQLIKNKKNFTVAVRIKPQLNQEYENCIMTKIKRINSKNQQIELGFQGKKHDYNNYGQNVNKKFVFDKVFQTDSKNAMIFQTLIEKKLSLLKKGVNLSILAYGATNSGKTFTIFGKRQAQINQLETQGLSFMVFKRIFQIYSRQYVMSFSFLQIYNQNVFDLLNADNIDNSLNVMEDSQGNTNVIGLTRVQIQNIYQIQTLITEGNNARISCSNIHNIHSSRSHAFIQMEMKHKITKQKTKMVIVDLAGSQKYIYKSSILSNTSNILKEGSNINKSLLSLGNCIKSLHQNQQHIPYRDSKLTRLLKQNLNGFAHNIMIACINTRISSFQQNVNSLQYAIKAIKIQKEIARKIQNQQLSEYQCSHCQQKIPYSLIKQINKHQKHKERVKTRQSQSLSVSPIAKFENDFCGFRSKSKSSATKINIQKIDQYIDETFQKVLKRISQENLTLGEIKGLIQSEKQALKLELNGQLSHSISKANKFEGKKEKAILVSQFQQIQEQKSIQCKNIKPNIISNVSVQKKLKICLSKPKKHIDRTVSTNNSTINKSPYLDDSYNSIKNPIKIQDQSNIQNSSGFNSFRSILTVQIPDDKEKIQKQRKKLLEETSYNQRKNSFKQTKNILKFKSTQNHLKNKNIQNFIIHNNENSQNWKSNQQNCINQRQINLHSTQDKLFYKTIFQQNPFIKIQQAYENSVRPFDHFIINKKLLDSTTVAPRMRKDQDDMVAWRNIYIKNVESPLNPSSNKKSQFEQSFVEYKVGVNDSFPTISKVFRY